MTPIIWLFTLLNKNVPMTPQEKESLQREATDWWNNEAVKSKVGALMKEWGDKWFIRLALAVLYIPMSRWLSDFMNPQIDEDDDEEDD